MLEYSKTVENVFMKKNLLSLAILTSASMTSVADIAVYGRAHLSVDLLDDGADYSELNMSSNSSRLGFKASKDYEGITALIQIEQEIDFSDSGSTFASRDTFLGLKGDFGLVRFGKFDTPFKQARGPANLFGDQVGDMRNITRVGNARFDERTSNTIHYQTPTFNGMQFNAAYSLHQGDNATDGTDDQAISLSATYKSGNLDAALAYESFSEDASRGERDALRLAGGYRLDNLRLVAFYQMADHSDDSQDSDVIGLGAEFTVTDKTLVKGQYFVRSAEADDSDSELFTIGVEHKVASDLRFYVNYAMMDNDDAINLAPWNQARTTDVSGAAGETASGLSMGVRFDF